MRRKPEPLRTDTREGFDFRGKWQTPEMIYRRCAREMEWFDALPPEKREIVKQNGEL